MAAKPKKKPPPKKRAPAKTGKRKAAAKAAQKVEIAERRRNVAALALTYVPQYRIAQQLGVSDGTISSDLKAIREGWREDAKADVQALAMRELASLDRLENSLWAQFVDQSTRQVRVTKANGDEYAFNESVVSIAERTRTAAQILRCKERRAKMLGFDQPDLLDVTITVEQAMAVMQEEIRTLEAVAAG